jgi:RHS repeat-associated protein
VTGAASNTIWYAGSLEKEVDVAANATIVRTMLPLGLGYVEERITGTAVAANASATRNPRYFLSDHLGSTLAVTDQTQGVLQRMSYDAWGRRRNPDDTDDAGALWGTIKNTQDHSGYTGHETLDQLALVHMNARLYDPILGRHTSADPTVPDPANTQSLNRYSYVLNNALVFIDPTGLQSEPKPGACGPGGGYFCKSIQLAGKSSANEPSDFAQDQVQEPPPEVGRRYQYNNNGPDYVERQIQQQGEDLKSGAKQVVAAAVQVVKDNPGETIAAVAPVGRLASAFAKLLSLFRAEKVAEARVAVALSTAGTNAAKGASELSFGRKLDFLFNKGIDQSNAYNAARAAGNAERIGIADTAANRTEVARLFNQAFRDPSSIVGPGKLPGSNVREFFLPGVTGTGSKIQFVEQGGKVITIIAK